MGKGIDSLKIKKRSQKLLFMEVKGTDGSHFERLEGFTTQTHNANPKEHNRQYVDEDTERTDVTGYSESVGYTFDHYIGQPALEEIVKITEEELIASDAVRRILTVDLSTATWRNMRCLCTTICHCPIQQRRFHGLHDLQRRFQVERRENKVPCPHCSRQTNRND